MNNILNINIWFNRYFSNNEDNKYLFIELQKLMITKEDIDYIITYNNKYGSWLNNLQKKNDLYKKLYKYGVKLAIDKIYFHKTISKKNKKFFAKNKLFYMLYGSPMCHLIEDYQIIRWTRHIPNNKNPIWKEMNFIFLHIPKTAGFSIMYHINPKHYFGHVFGRNYPQKYRSKIKTIVRNPYDRAVSAYFFIKKGGFRNTKEYLEIGKKYSTFESWILDGLKKEMLYWSVENYLMEPVMLQNEWLCDKNNKLILDLQNIGRFENLDQNVNRLFGINNLQTLNKTEHMNWKEYYKNEKIKDKIYEYYKKDFEILNYPKEIN